MINFFVFARTVNLKNNSAVDFILCQTSIKPTIQEPSFNTLGFFLHKQIKALFDACKARQGKARQGTLNKSFR